MTIPNGLNQLMLSGTVLGRPRVYTDGTLVFTLENGAGRFYVRWISPTWKPASGSQVMVSGSVFGAKCKCGRHVVRIQANEVILMNGNGS